MRAGICRQKKELKVFTQNDAVHDAVNRTLIAIGGTKLYDRSEAAWYWSSTEEGSIYTLIDRVLFDAFFVCSVDMCDGGTDTGIRNKFDLNYVRAVAVF